MKKSWQLFLTLTIVVVGTFLFNQKVLAFSYITQDDISASAVLTGSGTSLLCCWQYFDPNWTTSTEAIYNLTMTAKTNKACDVKAYLYFSRVGNSGTGCGDTGAEYLLLSKNTISSVAGKPTAFNFTIDKTAGCNRLDKLRRITIHNYNCGSGWTDQNGTWYGSNTSSSFPFGGSAGVTTICEPNFPDSTIKDLFFQISTVNSATDLQVDFYSRPTPRSDFQNWALNFYIDEAYQETAKEFWSIGVAWHIQSGTNLEDYVFMDFGELTQTSIEAMLAGVPKKTEMASSTTYYARAFLIDTRNPINFTQDHVLAYSSEYVFEVNSTNMAGNSSWTLYNPTTSTESKGWEYSCDLSKGFFSSTMCNMFLFLFYPMSSDLDKWVSLKYELEDKPPFGYIKVYTEQFKTIATSTSSTLETMIGTDYNTYTDVQDISIFSKIFTALEWLLWLLFGFWVLNRFRHFNFHL